MYTSRWLSVIVATVTMFGVAGPTAAEDPPTFVASWGTGGTGPGQFANPVGVAVDAGGNVYVCDTNNNRIQKFDSHGVFVAAWGTPGTGEGQFNLPMGIAVDADGFVYVADFYNSRIQKFDATGTFVSAWGSYGSGDGQFAYPAAIATDLFGYVYVGDANYNYRVQKFESNGQFVTKWGGPGTGDGQFRYPYGVAVDAFGFVYVADDENHRIQKFTSGGVFVGKWGVEGSGDGQFEYPSAVAVDNAGNVYVVDTFNYRMQKFDSSGSFLAAWGGRGNGDGQFIFPAGVAVDAAGNVYVTDNLANRVDKFGAASADDHTPPIIASSATGTIGAGGWYVTNVAVNWTVNDNESAISSTVGCGSALVDSDTPGTLFACAATSAGGTSSGSITVKRDATPPIVSYAGNAGTYTVAANVNINCSASDAMSGLSSTTCMDITGSAWAFGVGPHSYYATAMDHAGLSASASTSFTVTADFNSLSALVFQFSSHMGVAQGLSAKLAAARDAAARGQAKTKRNNLDAFVHQVDAQRGKALTSQQADLLKSLAAGL